MSSEGSKRCACDKVGRLLDSSIPFGSGVISLRSSDKSTTAGVSSLGVTAFTGVVVLAFFATWFADFGGLPGLLLTSAMTANSSVDGNRKRDERQERQRFDLRCCT